MSTEILFPQLGFTMTEGTLAEWLVADGAEVTAGQPRYVLESDKSTLEIEAPASGRLRIGARAGEVFPIGAVLGEIV